MSHAAAAPGGPSSLVGPVERNFVTSLPSSALGGAAEASLYQGHVVAIGDQIDTSAQDGFLRGKGTQVVREQLVATVSGYVERVNKLVSVRPLRSRYQAMAGDVVVGRVTDVAGKRWRLDLHCGQEAFLMLSAVTLQGSIQRRTTSEDELNMRLLFQEGDLISAEVQQLFHDGSVALQTRSRKYGLLKHGQLVAVPSNLIKRLKQHFTVLEGEGVDLVIGLNGFIWVSPHRDEGDAAGAGEGAAGEEEDPRAPTRATTPAERERVVRVAAAIEALARCGAQVHPRAVSETYHLSRELGVPPRDMSRAEFLTEVLRQEQARQD
jgi:exosome complex component RRP4